jgi:hypothetical protein
MKVRVTMIERIGAHCSPPLGKNSRPLALHLH